MFRLNANASFLSSKAFLSIRVLGLSDFGPTIEKAVSNMELYISTSN
ncbi:MAG: hypothetical protein ACYDBX_02120 [Patescibacteria group bacterium]